MIYDIFLILLPVIFLGLGGFVSSKLYELSEESLVRIVTDFFMPILVFHSLYASTIVFSDTLKLLGAVTIVVLILAVCSISYCRYFKLDFKSHLPPLLFMNSGFIGIPLMQLWGGITAVNYIILYDQFQTFYIFTLGIFIVTNGVTASGLKEMARSPLLWAIFSGFLFRFLQIPIPAPLLHSLEYAGVCAPALAIFAMGCALNTRSIHMDIHLISGLGIRFFVGFAAGFIAAELLGIRGMERSVIMIASALPSGVFSAVLPMRYGVTPVFANSMIFASCVSGIFVLPLLIYLSQHIR